VQMVVGRVRRWVPTYPVGFSQWRTTSRAHDSLNARGELRRKYHIAVPAWILRCISGMLDLSMCLCGAELEA
jgi:hypothetical protein